MAARLIRAALLTALIDGLFSSVLSAVFYGSTVARLFQGVAATAFGAGAFGGGARLTLVGVVMHVTVAFTWSAIFLVAYEQSAWLRRIAGAPFGVFKVAIVYGPLIWVVMSMVVIAALTGRTPAITVRWWIQFFGHAFFVGLPIVSMIVDRRRAR
jgi:hypothetical protein